MVLLYQCDVCGRIKDRYDVMKEGWHIVTAKSIVPSDNFDIPSETIYCGRCYTFYCASSKWIDKEYEKIKGTPMDKYAGE